MTPKDLRCSHGPYDQTAPVPREPAPRPSPGGPQESHDFAVHSPVDGVELNEALEHDDGAGLAVERAGRLSPLVVDGEAQPEAGPVQPDDGSPLRLDAPVQLGRRLRLARFWIGPWAYPNRRRAPSYWNRPPAFSCKAPASLPEAAAPPGVRWRVSLIRAHKEVTAVTALGASRTYHPGIGASHGPAPCPATQENKM